MTSPAPALPSLLTLSQVAAFRGVHYDTARKGWQGWVRRGFPAPVDTAPLRWNAAACQAWLIRAEAEQRAAVLAPETGAPANQNDPRPGRPAPPRLSRDRETLFSLMQHRA